MLSGKRILLIVGGGIAAYKSQELVRLLRKQHVEVKCVLTRAGAEFVTPLTLGALAGNKVFTELFNLTDEAEMGHIELSRAADLVVVAPATADLMAKLSHGLANDLASTVLLATDKTVLLAPSMNVRMWYHPATQRNLKTLGEDGHLFVGPNEGEMACGEFGPGRMAEPGEILAAIEAALQHSTVLPLQDTPFEPATHAPALAVRPQPALAPAPAPEPVFVARADGPLAGRHIIVTSGPTHEPIDPVRYIANRSSGKQGHAIAGALAELGAHVTLVSGPVSIAAPQGIETIAVESAREMLAAVENALPADAFVACAAVADWRVARAADEKIKKVLGARGPTLAMVENPDILATVSRKGKARPRLVVGFAAETTKVIEHAIQKRARKGCDWIVANDVSQGSGVMGGDDNTVHLVTVSGVESWEKASKVDVARRLAQRMAERLSS
jgi:phosphopantothenoylcysteine decarboxylase / phosphopantothenate---cysteine ligase